MTRRVLFLAPHPIQAAATRFRAAGYFEALRRVGIEPVLSPFLDEAGFSGFYARGQRFEKARAVLRGLVRQFGTLVEDCEAVFVRREAMLLGPALLEFLFRRVRRLPLIFDIDDAIWLSHHEHSRHPALAKLLRSPAKAVDSMRLASAVFAGSEYLARFARQHAERVIVLRTGVSAEAWAPPPGKLAGARYAPDGVPIIGWIGTHSTAPQLELAARALERLASSGERFRVRVIGGTAPRLSGVEVEQRAWSLEREISDFHDLDIGLAPLFDDAWALGKCAFKQIQYMAAGVPQVSSPVGAALEVLVREETCLFAETPDAWESGLRRLLRDAELRRAIASRARSRFEASYSLEAQQPTFATEILRLLGSSGSA